MSIDLSKLDRDQRAAATAPDGPLLVIAGAGSGKTRTLTARVAHLISERGVDPAEIMAVTFTRKAADEMRRRIAKLIGEEQAPRRVGTFHAQLAMMLRRAGEERLGRFGRTPSFTVMDEDDREKLIRREIKAAGLNDIEAITPRAVASAISKAKNAGLTVERAAELRSTPGGVVGAAAGSLWPKIEAAARSADAFDFDDLLLVPLLLIESDAPYRRMVAGSITHLLVDEYQDVNEIQARLVAALSSEHKNVFAVGDDAQGIYSFRGAEIRHILEFERAFPGARRIVLHTNYRSTQVICDVANAVLAGSRQITPKSIVAGPAAPTGPKPIYRRHGTEWEEARAAAKTAQEAKAAGLRYGDVAILLRTNGQTRVFEQCLSERGVPYRIMGGMAFWAREEVRDLIAWLRVIANPRDEIAIRRSIAAPRRGVGDTAIEKIAALAADRGGDWWTALKAAANGEVDGIGAKAREGIRLYQAQVDRWRVAFPTAFPAEIAEQVVRDTGLGDHHADGGSEEGKGRLENLAEASGAAAPFGEGELVRFIETATLDTTTGSERREPPDAVVIATMHAAKGLEWPIVHVCGLDDGILPHGGSAHSFEGLEEERRLLYVGVTRAQRRLYLSGVFERTSGAARGPMVPSRFLAELRAVVEVAPGTPAAPRPGAPRWPGSTRPTGARGGWTRR